MGESATAHRRARPSRRKDLAGAFYTGSTNDAIAAYSDGAQGATIAISRYFGTGAGALPNLGQQYLSITAGGPNEMIFSGPSAPSARASLCWSGEAAETDPTLRRHQRQRLPLQAIRGVERIGHRRNQP